MSQTRTMRVQTESHLYATTVLEGQFQAAWRELRAVLDALLPPLRTAGFYTTTGRPKTPKRQRRPFGGRSANVLMPIDQSEMNHAIDRALVASGWLRQPYILVDGSGRPIDTRLRGDFEKQGVFVEIEFGNMASLYRDLFKFHIAGTSGAARVGAIVLATADLAKLFDQGVATYEQAVSLLPYMRAGLQLPTAIVGIDVPDWTVIRARYGEMQAVVEANGERCHTFETVMAMPAPEVLDDGLGAGNAI